MLVLACWPRLEPSALHVKAAVEQPVFVTPLAAVAKRTAHGVNGSADRQGCDRQARDRAARAAHAVHAASSRRPRRDAGDTDRRGSQAVRGRPRRLRQGRHRDRARVFRQRRRGRRRPRARCARRHVRSGDARAVSASSGSRAMGPRRATIMRARSPPARPGLASGSPLWRRNRALNPTQCLHLTRA